MKGSERENRREEKSPVAHSVRNKIIHVQVNSRGTVCSSTAVHTTHHK